jgi:hypothetical protein
MPRGAPSGLRALFDRSNETVRVYQDLAMNASLFAFAIYAMHKWGHKLAV